MKEVLKQKWVILLAFFMAISYLPETVYAAGVGVDTTEGRSNIMADNHLDTRPDTGGTKTVDHMDWKGQHVGGKYMAIVFRKEQTDLYINGKLAVEEKANYALEDILENDGIFQIGKVNWNTIGERELYTGYLDEYTIFDHALTAEEIKILSQKPGDVSSDTDIDVDIGDGEKPNSEKPDPENPNPETPNQESPDSEKPSPEKPNPESPSPETPSQENPDSEIPSSETTDPDNGNNQQPSIFLTLPYTAVTIPKGKTLSIKAKVIPSNTPLTWKTSNASVVKVKNGKITGRKSGKATISVQAGNVRARCKVTVAEVSWNVKSAILQVGTSSSALQIGKRYPQKDKIKAYKSSNPKIVRINQKGKITAGKKPGKAILTVIMASGASTSCKITVQKKAVRIQKISLNKKNLIPTRGGRARLDAIRKPVTATGKIIWASSNRRVATVDKNGIVKARKKGKAKIIAKTSNGKKAVCSIAVK